MKKFLLALSVLAIGTATASAADLPAKAYTKAPAVIPVQIYDWSGFYIGINGGGGSAHNCWTAIGADGIPEPPQAEGCHNATGGTVGGQIGYRWQVTNWVFGVEAQGNWADFKGSNTNLAISQGVVDDHTKVDAFGLFTGQVGYAWDRALFYVKGGAAVTDNKYSIATNALGAPLVPPGTLFSTAAETRWGSTVGAGVEFAFAPGWSVGVEYDHLFMGTTDRAHDVVFPTAPPGSTLTQRISQNVDVGLVRVNYRFGGPVVAKY